MTRPRVHVLTPGLAPGDAVTHDALGMAAFLRRRGVGAEVYGDFIDPALRGAARPLAAYEPHLASRDDVLLYHHSVGWPRGLGLWRRTRNRRVLKYHNVTPAHFVAPHFAPHADSCRVGAAETAELATSRADALLADSPFNARDLERAGARPGTVDVVPPFHRVGDLTRLPPDDDLAERLRGRVNLLFVGRVSPNKGHRRLLAVAARLRDHLRLDARLFVVGGFDPRLEDYYGELRADVGARRLAGRVFFPGKVTPRQLATYYRHASVFLCLSEHEGFCVPLVEAMYYGVPVVAYRGTGITATLGDAALAWDAPDPLLAAESVARLVHDAGARAAVAAAQRARYDACFSPEALGRCFAAALAPVLPGVFPDDAEPAAARQLQPA
jgi:glycosyltransferase involved in cell wall biosynthesis